MEAKYELIWIYLIFNIKLETIIHYKTLIYYLQYKTEI